MVFVATPVMQRVLTLAQWVLGVAIAILLAPTLTHPAVLAVVFLGGAMCLSSCLRHNREVRDLALRTA